MRGGEGRRCDGQVQDVAALEVAGLRDAIEPVGEIGVVRTEDRLEPLGRPDEKQTFIVVAVGGRVEPPPPVSSGRAGRKPACGARHGRAPHPRSAARRLGGSARAAPEYRASSRSAGGAGLQDRAVHRLPLADCRAPGDDLVRNRTKNPPSPSRLCESGPAPYRSGLPTDSGAPPNGALCSTPKRQYRPDHAGMLLMPIRARRVFSRSSRVRTVQPVRLARTA